MFSNPKRVDAVVRFLYAKIERLRRNVSTF
jgi:hypothetical protein